MRVDGSDRSSAGDDDGFALIAALAIIAVIAAAAVAFVVTVQIRAKTAANTVEIARLKLIADGIARQTAFALMESIHANETAEQAAPSGYRCAPRAGVTAAVRIQDQSGLVDLNAASPDVLRRLFQVGREVPNPPVAAIVDFRDDDSDTGVGGGEAPEYKRAGKAYGPKNAPFQSVDELDQVLGIDANMAADMLPFATVHNFQDGFDPKVAPKRLADIARSDSTIPSNTTPKQFYGIEVTVSGDSGGRFHRHAIAAMTNEAQRPFQFVEWSEINRTPPEAAELPARARCGVAE